MNTQREEQAKKIVKLILKEFLILAICVGIAFLGKSIFYHTFIQSNQPPLVSQEKQKALMTHYKEQDNTMLQRLQWD